MKHGQNTVESLIAFLTIIFTLSVFETLTLICGEIVASVYLYKKNDLFEKVKITRVCEHINDCLVLLFSLAEIRC